MHEHGVVHAAAAALADAAAGRPVRSATIGIGPGMDPATTRAAWAAAASSVLGETAVTWVRVPDRLACLDCGHEYPGSATSRCPRCRGDGLLVRPAPEVEILDWSTGQDDG